MPDTKFGVYRFSVIVKRKYRLDDHVRPRMDQCVRGGSGAQLNEKGWGAGEGMRERIRETASIARCVSVLFADFRGMALDTALALDLLNVSRGF